MLIWLVEIVPVPSRTKLTCDAGQARIEHGAAVGGLERGEVGLTAVAGKLARAETLSWLLAPSLSRMHRPAADPCQGRQLDVSARQGLDLGEGLVVGVSPVIDASAGNDSTLPAPVAWSVSV